MAMATATRTTTAEASVVCVPPLPSDRDMSSSPLHRPGATAPCGGSARRRHVFMSSRHAVVVVVVAVVVSRLSISCVGCAWCSSSCMACAAGCVVLLCIITKSWNNRNKFPESLPPFTLLVPTPPLRFHTSCTPSSCLRRSIHPSIPARSAPPAFLLPQAHRAKFKFQTFKPWHSSPRPQGSLAQPVNSPSRPVPLRLRPRSRPLVDCEEARQHHQKKTRK